MTNINHSQIAAIHKSLSFREYLEERHNLRLKYFHDPRYQTIYKSRALRSLSHLEHQKCSNYQFIYSLIYPHPTLDDIPSLSKKTIKSLIQELTQHPQKYQHINWDNFYTYLEECLQIIRHPFLYNETYTIYSYFKPIRENLIQNYANHQLIWY